jgi:hypothetical protein
MKCSSTWVSLAASKVEHAGEQLSEKSEFALPTKAFSVIADVTACSFAESLISGRVRAQVQDKTWATGDWYQIDLLHEGPEVFDKLNWILARIPMSTSITGWQSIDEGVSPISSRDSADRAHPNPADSRTALQDLLASPSQYPVDEKVQHDGTQWNHRRREWTRGCSV